MSNGRRLRRQAARARGELPEPEHREIGYEQARSQVARRGRKLAVAVPRPIPRRHLAS